MPHVGDGRSAEATRCTNELSLCLEKCADIVKSSGIRVVDGNMVRWLEVMAVDVRRTIR